MRKFENLKNACSKYPEIHLQVENKPTVYNLPKPKAKNGFIQKFACDKSH